MVIREGSGTCRLATWLSGVGVRRGYLVSICAEFHFPGLQVLVERREVLRCDLKIVTGWRNGAFLLSDFEGKLCPVPKLSGGFYRPASPIARQEVRMRPLEKPMIANGHQEQEYDRDDNLPHR